MKASYVLGFRYDRSFNFVIYLMEFETPMIYSPFINVSLVHFFLVFGIYESLDSLYAFYCKYSMI
jgi:hypothetical protein